MARLRIGTCSWKYDSWKGLVYTSGLERNRLAEYARRYETVEVDQWFWSLFGSDQVKLPDSAEVQSYAEAVGEDFRFSVKLPNALTLTHFYRRRKSDPLVVNPHFLSRELLERFLERMEPLRDCLGPLMLQFEYLNRQKMPSQRHFTEQLGRFLEECPTGYEFAVESRNPNYLNASLRKCLEESETGIVLLEGYYLPPVWDVYTRLGRLPGRLCVIRLHGPDRAGMEKRTGKRWDTLVEPRDQALDRVARLVRDILARGWDVYLNINNHYEGSAPLTIRRLEERLASG